MSDERALAGLREVAELSAGAPVTLAFYNTHRGAGSLSSARLIQIYGSWRAACEAAGIEANAASRAAYSRRWSHADLIAWVSKYAASAQQPS